MGYRGNIGGCGLHFGRNLVCSDVCKYVVVCCSGKVCTPGTEPSIDTDVNSLRDCLSTLGNHLCSRVVIQLSYWLAHSLTPVSIVPPLCRGGPECVGWAKGTNGLRPLDYLALNTPAAALIDCKSGFTGTVLCRRQISAKCASWEMCTFLVLCL